MNFLALAADAERENAEREAERQAARAAEARDMETDRVMRDEERKLMNIPVEELTISQAHRLRSFYQRLSNSDSERRARLGQFIATIPNRLLPGGLPNAPADSNSPDARLTGLIASLADNPEDDSLTRHLADVQETRRLEQGQVRRPYVRRHRRVAAICRLVQQVPAEDLPDDARNCIICGEEMLRGQDEGLEAEIPVRLPCPGGHVFGHACIHQWLADPTINTCPTCRHNFSGELQNRRNQRPVTDSEGASFLELYASTLAADESLQDVNDAAEEAARAAREPARERAVVPLIGVAEFEDIDEIAELAAGIATMARAEFDAAPPSRRRQISAAIDAINAALDAAPPPRRRQIRAAIDAMNAAPRPHPGIRRRRRSSGAIEVIDAVPRPRRRSPPMPVPFNAMDARPRRRRRHTPILLRNGHFRIETTMVMPGSVTWSRVSFLGPVPEGGNDDELYNRFTEYARNGHDEFINRMNGFLEEAVEADRVARENAENARVAALVPLPAEEIAALDLQNEAPPAEVAAANASPVESGTVAPPPSVQEDEEQPVAAEENAAPQAYIEDNASENSQQSDSDDGSGEFTITELGHGYGGGFGGL